MRWNVRQIQMIEEQFNMKKGSSEEVNVEMLKEEKEKQTRLRQEEAAIQKEMARIRRVIENEKKLNRPERCLRARNKRPKHPDDKMTSGRQIKIPPGQQEEKRQRP